MWAVSGEPLHQGPLPGESWRQGITKESFDALESVCFKAARPGRADLEASSISDLKQLVRSHTADAAGAIEKRHLVDALSAHFAATPFVCSETMMCVDNPLQCAVCMVDFVDSEELL